MKTRPLCFPQGTEKMVFFSAVKLEELFKKGRDYPWQKPQDHRSDPGARR